MCTQSIGYGFSSTVISSARQGIFLIPSVLILPALLGITGLQAAQPAADVLAFILAAVIMRRVLKKLGDMEESMDIPVGKD
jgi:Na+-driven multidrug efflux pump